MAIFSQKRVAIMVIFSLKKRGELRACDFSVFYKKRPREEGEFDRGFWVAVGGCDGKSNVFLGNFF